MRTLSRLSLLLLVTLSAACDLDTLMSAAAVPDGPTGLVAPTRPSTPPRGPQRLASSGAAPSRPGGLTTPAPAPARPGDVTNPIEPTNPGDLTTPFAPCPPPPPPALPLHGG